MVGKGFIVRPQQIANLCTGPWGGLSQQNAR
jgi:hypothetical protein